MNGLHDNTAYLICAQSEPALAAATSSYLKINIDTDSLRNRQISSLNPNSKIHVLTAFKNGILYVVKMDFEIFSELSDLNLSIRL